MIKTAHKLLLGLLVCFVVNSGCTTAHATAGSTENPLPFQSTAADISTLVSQEDYNALWEASLATSITLNTDTVQISGTGATADGKVVTITESGDYVLQGTLSDGQILIDTDKQSVVRLILNGVTMTNSTTAPIYAKKAAKTIIILNSGTQNSITDAQTYVYAEDEDEPNAPIFAKNDLTITGDGALTVNGQYKNGIGSKDVLRITGGTITVNAVNNGIRGKDGLIITDGNFTVQSGNDAFKANNDSDETKGYIHISGGTFNIQAEQDGFQAETALTISGGVFNVTTGGGAAAAPVKQEAFGGRGGGSGLGQMQGGSMPQPPQDGDRPEPPDWDLDGDMPNPPADRTELGQGQGQRPEFSPQDRTMGDESTQDTALISDEESDSKKAFKSGQLLTISGGTFIVDAQDDAFHANANMVIAGGQFDIKTGDDAFHADLSLVVNDGIINVTQCYEGLEGTTVDINGGDITIIASDDAINAADGTGETFGRSSESLSKFYIRVTGGTINIQSLGDGFDSNGNLYFDGGTIYVNGPNSSADAALDCDGEMVINGGLIVATGSASMLPVAASSGTQHVLYVYYSTTQEAGSTVTLKDASGNTVATYQSPKAYQSLVISAPALVAGQTYSLYSGQTKLTDVTLTDTVTRISEDGSAVTGNTGGRGGQRPDGMQDQGDKPERQDMPEGGGRGFKMEQMQSSGMQVNS